MEPSNDIWWKRTLDGCRAMPLRHPNQTIGLLLVGPAGIPYLYCFHSYASVDSAYAKENQHQMKKGLQWMLSKFWSISKRKYDAVQRLFFGALELRLKVFVLCSIVWYAQINAASSTRRFNMKVAFRWLLHMKSVFCIHDIIEAYSKTKSILFFNTLYFIHFEGY